MHVTEAAKLLRIEPKRLRQWMCLTDDPCPPGDPGADCDLAAIATWMGRTGRGSRNGRGQEALKLAQDGVGAAQAAQRVAATLADQEAEEDAPEDASADLADLDLSDPAVVDGLPEIPPTFKDPDTARKWWDAKLKSLRYKQLKGKLVPRDEVEQQHLLRTQRLVSIISRLPDRFATLLIHRTENEARQVLTDMVREIREEMAKAVGQS